MILFLKNSVISCELNVPIKIKKSSLFFSLDLFLEILDICTDVTGAFEDIFFPHYKFSFFCNKRFVFFNF